MKLITLVSTLTLLFSVEEIALRKVLALDSACDSLSFLSIRFIFLGRAFSLS